MRPVSALLGFLAASGAAVPALAEETSAALEVRLYVEPSCEIAAAPVRQAFSSITDATILGTSTVSLACPPGTDYALAIDAGSDKVRTARRDSASGWGSSVEFEVARPAGDPVRLAAYQKPGGGATRSIPSRRGEPVVVAVDF